MAKTKWTTWAVPIDYIPFYLFVMFLSLYVLPRFFGISFTILGWLINLLWFDFVFYIWYKVKITIEMIKGKDDNESDRME
jgi:hypothetical protein